MASNSSTLEHKDRIVKDILSETYVNISFCILVSILAIFSSLLYFVSSSSVYLRIVSFVVYCPLFIFLLTLFVVLKRVYILLADQLKEN